MKFEISRVQGAPVSDEEILDNLRKAATDANVEALTQAIYSRFGKFDPSTAKRRFGSWNKAAAAAGLSTANEINISDEKLFQNILDLWEHFGRQPRQSELARHPSKISWGAYRRRFKTWINTLNVFVYFVNEGFSTPKKQDINISSLDRQRSPSLRARFRVMKRDNFTCCACGASPAIAPGTLLHVDHIIPWSRGGHTVDENLQTLCELCNLGKGNVF